MLEAQPEIPAEVSPPDHYRLIISHEDDTPQTHKLNHFRMVIGRAQDCDIPLFTDNISRYHATLEWTGRSWQITDLGSTNGTYFNGERLAPEDPIPFSPNQAFHIGPYTFQLQSANQPLIASPPTLRVSAPPPQRPPAPQPPRSSAPLPPPANRFSFDIRPSQIVQQGICRVLLINLGPDAASYTLTAVSPTHALSITPPQHQTHLAAGQKAAVDFLIEVQKRRKSHPFHITVSNGTHEHTLAGTAKA
jgi:hypothetical protein